MLLIWVKRNVYPRGKKSLDLVMVLLWNSIYTYGWSLEKAISDAGCLELETKLGKIEFRGKVQTLTAHARDFGLGKTTVDARLAKGWDLEKSSYNSC